MKDNVATESRSSTLSGVERTARILQAVEAAGSSNLAEIARRTNLNEATVLRYLNSLSSLGFIERVEPATYRLGWEIFRLGQRTLSTQVPRAAIRPAMESLVTEFNETVNFAIVRQRAIVIVDVVESSRAVKKISFVGQSDPWHASALGKSILATMPDLEWRAVLEEAGLRRLTEHTITSLNKMEVEIAATRERGYAVDDEEVDDELTCIAAAIPTSDGKPAQSALSISFVTHRLTPGRVEDAGHKITAAAKEIALRLN
ncbi:IclR family transcriptional regulator [Rhodococcus sp. F64268]|uniref:IclR family transcriptional regulator n=1 Tax=Rhodococcus sp. F64268 TaxID=2926402 RepID=UPI001FF19792|nr:IclR family transcriptional regulator [Rhodococcus sp. F64268]MCK0089243.1 IclR family transcriptional regulator [Rhodococcus sp. F64268]